MQGLPALRSHAKEKYWGVDSFSRMNCRKSATVHSWKHCVQFMVQKWREISFFYIWIFLLKLKRFRIRFIFFYCHSDVTSEMHYISVNVWIIKPLCHNSVCVSIFTVSWLLSLWVFRAWSRYQKWYCRVSATNSVGRGKNPNQRRFPADPANWPQWASGAGEGP